MDFPSSPSDGDTFNGFIYNGTLGVWDILSSLAVKRFTITNSGTTSYVFSGDGTSSDSNPTLYLTRGETYEFVVNASGHPFYIKTVSGTGTGNAYTDGVTGNGAETGTVTFTVQMDAPDTLYYNCSHHSSMAGTIYVVNSTLALTDFSVTTNSAGTAALSYSNSTGVFTYTPPDLSGYLTAETNDLTSAVTWANVPNANITESSVTQHQSALSITESQISDLGTYLTSVALNDVSDVTITSASNGQVLKYNGTAWVNSADSGIALTDLSITTNSAGTAALSYNNSTGTFTFTPPDLSSYLTAETNDLTSTVTWANVPNANITESSVTQHQAALSITESQISDLQTYLTSYTETDTLDSVTGRGNSTTNSITVGDATVTGNLTVQGTTTTLETATLSVEDKNITINYSTGDSSGSADGAGITIQDAVNSTTDATILWDATGDKFEFSHAVDVTGNITATGNLTVDTNTLFVNATNNRVGIGTTNPAYQVEIENTGANALLVLDRTDGAACFIEGQASRSAFGSVGATPLALAYNSLAVVEIGANGAITVNPDGNSYTFPTADGTNGQVLTTDGSGTVSFSSVPAETNDLTSAVTWANVPNANITESSVTQHQAALSITESQISDLQTYLTGITGQSIENLSDVTTMTPTDGQVLTWDNTNSYWYAASPSGGSYGDSSVDTHLNTSTAATNEVLSWNGSDYAWVSQSGGVALTDFSVTTNSAGTAALSYNNTTGVFSYTPPDLSSYLTAETNDLTSAVTWANVPNANITESSVTQHQAALSITESQISDFGTYLTGITGENIGNLSDVTITSAAAGEILRYNGSGWVNSDPIAGRFSIVNSGSGAYVFTGSGTSSDSNPTLYLTRGQTYEFVVNASGHPFYINTSSGTGTGNAYSDGVTNNGAETGTVTLDVQMDAPDTLYYNCQYHSSMAGTIYILDSTVGLSDFSVTTASAGTAALSYSNGVFTYTPPDLSSYLTGITGQSIENLSDVNTMTPTDGQVLTWDNANSRWDAASPSGGSYSDSSVDTHLNTSTASTNEVLSWDGSDYSWVAQSGGGSYSDSSVDTHLNTSTATANQVLSWTGSDYDWVAQSGGGGGASVTISDSAPSSPSAGDLWFESTGLILYVSYNDGDSTQWVQTNPSGAGSSASDASNSNIIALNMFFGG